MLFVFFLDIIYISLILTGKPITGEIIGMMLCAVGSLLFGVFDDRVHVNNGGY